MPSADEVRDGQRATWARLSASWEKWDSIIMDQLGPVGAAIIERLDIAEDQQHLDIASGTGEPGLSIARLSPKGRVVLTDLAPEMLDVAARRARAQGVANIETKVCSADDLPFNDATFGSVSVRFGYMFFPDMAKATAEFARAQAGRTSLLVGMDQARRKPLDDDRHAGHRHRGGGAATRPRRTEHVSVRCPWISRCPIRGRWATRRCRVGRRRRTRDAIARRVLGDDQRPRLARGCGASERRRTGAGADSGTRHCKGKRLRNGRQGPGAGFGAVHRGNEIGREAARAHAAARDPPTRAGREPAVHDRRQVSPLRPLRIPVARLMRSNQNGAPSISANAVAPIPMA